MGRFWGIDRIVVPSVRHSIAIVVTTLVLLQVSLPVLKAQGKFQFVFDSILTNRGSVTIIQTSDSGYLIITGSDSSDLSYSSVLKLSPLGQLEWRYGSKTQGYVSIAELSNHNIFALGTTGFTILMPDGNLLFDSVGLPGEAVSVIADNDSAVVASFVSDSLIIQKITNLGGTLWTTVLPQGSLQLQDLHNIKIAPRRIIFSRQNDYVIVSDSLIVALNKSGKELWRKPHQPGLFFEIRGVIETGEFNVGALPSYHGLNIHFDPLGTPQDTVGQSGNSFVVSQNEIAFTAIDFGAGNVASGSAIEKETGRVVWSNSYADPPHDSNIPRWNSGIDIIRTIDGGYAIAGLYGAECGQGCDPPGEVYIIKTDSLGNTDSLQLVTVSPTSAVNKLPDALSLELSPNPTTGIVTVRGAAGSTVITNVLGQVVLTATAQQGESITLNLTNEPPGVYLWRLTSDGESVTRRVVVMH